MGQARLTVWTRTNIASGIMSVWGGNKCPWDLVIAHPPCTHLTNMTWNWGNQNRIPDWWAKHQEGKEFFLACLDANAKHIAVENPPLMNPPARDALGTPDCTTDFMYFGEKYRKRVGWWLRNLPPLIGSCHSVGVPSLVTNEESCISQKKTGCFGCNAWGKTSNGP